MHNQTDNIARTVGVVLVNWNGAEHTVPCIESLLAGTVKPDRIVVVDNASHDNSADQISDSFLDIDLVRNSENAGFTGANNIGISRLLLSGCSYIWILNNDTLVDRHCLAILKKYMDLHPDVSACSGKIKYPDPSNVIWYAGATYNKWTLHFIHRGVGEEDAGQYDLTASVPFLSGCCMFARPSAIARIGMFDNHFFAYNEDSDWCLRGARANLQMHYVPQAVIYHKVSATVNKIKKPRTGGTTSPFVVYIINRNKIYLIRKHSKSLLQTCTAFLAFAAEFCYYGSALLLLLRIDKFRALVGSVYDGLTGSLDDSLDRTAAPRYLP